MIEMANQSNRHRDDDDGMEIRRTRKQVLMPLMQRVVVKLREWFRDEAKTSPLRGRFNDVKENFDLLAWSYEECLTRSLINFRESVLDWPVERVIRTSHGVGDESRIRWGWAQKFRDRLETLLKDWTHLVIDPADDGPRFVRLGELARHLLWLTDRTQVRLEEGITLLHLLPHDLENLADERRQLVLQSAAQWLSDGALSFPWKRWRFERPAEEAQRMMERLREFASGQNENTRETSVIPTNVLFRSRQSRTDRPLFSLVSVAVFRQADHHYDEFDVLVDLFQEEARLRARRKDTERSVMEAWTSDPKWVRSLMDDAVRQEGQITCASLREAVYRHSRECTQFKPGLAVFVIRHFSATRILDFSAGWGDRLAAAVAMRPTVRRYCGFDPNESLKTGHSEMLELFVPDPIRRQEFADLHYLPFEAAGPPAGETFDLVFTSPPFYDFEIYVPRGVTSGQSIDLYPNLHQWLSGFLFASLSLAWKALDIGGHAVIHLSDMGKFFRVCEPMCLFMQWKLPGAHYLGVICSFGAADIARPLWVFQKRNECDAHHSRQAGRELKRLFPELWSICKQG